METEIKSDGEPAKKLTSYRGFRMKWKELP